MVTSAALGVVHTAASQQVRTEKRLCANATGLRLTIAAAMDACAVWKEDGRNMSMEALVATDGAFEGALRAPGAGNTTAKSTAWAPWDELNMWSSWASRYTLSDAVGYRQCPSPPRSHTGKSERQ